MTYALPLADCTPELAPRVGGKAVGLGRLLQQALEVPPGFVVTTDAYLEWLAERRLEAELERLVAGAVDAAECEAASQEVAALFASAEPSRALVADIGRAYAELGGDALVAVRSSATAEDLADASFAGQQETYLGVAGAGPVVRHVVRCWASLFTPQAISYRRRLGIPTERVAMAVLVQRMVAAEVSGVMLTLDPVTGDRSQITIESALGLGLPVVGGELTPDRYAVDKVTLELRSRTISQQPFADRLAAAGGVRRDELGDEGAASSLLDEEVVRLAEVGKRTERALGGPVDMEWAIGPGPDGPRHLHLLQARPETVWSSRQSAPVAVPATSAVDRIVAMMLPKGTRSQSA
ncbi:MAG TPA: PEP/pyruvate-binding domain-containing protein [Candidatus Dormibacteraeota bacterium]|nr:PEP/pyruvate-binding domain-containing protein [Candidatus Dormibacteraeota bacterium]